MLRLAHLSDLHFGRAEPALTQHLLSQLQDAELDLVVISGDLTQRATHAEFQQAHAFLQQLPALCLVVPGNHDLAAFNLLERFGYPWQKWRQYISPELDSVRSGPGFVAVGLNSARQLAHHPDWSRGRINSRQLSWMQRQFAAYPSNYLRILVTHHPFYLSEAARSRGHVGRHHKAWPVLQAAGADLLLSGHLHLAYAFAVKGMIVAQAGSGVSNRLKGEANSYNLISWHQQHLTLETRMWQGETFLPEHKQTFEKTPQGWQLQDLATPANSQSV